MLTIASTTLHPAPPKSYTVFMAGCNFKCLNCQNWTISQYPDNGYAQRGSMDPKELAQEAIDTLDSLCSTCYEFRVMLYEDFVKFKNSNTRKEKMKIVQYVFDRLKTEWVLYHWDDIRI